MLVTSPNRVQRLPGVLSTCFIQHSDETVVLILSSNQLSARKLRKAFPKLISPKCICLMMVRHQEYRDCALREILTTLSHLKESEVSDNSGGRQYVREPGRRAASRGGALTLVSFAKGVSPPQRSTLNIRPPQTLRFTQQKCLVRNTADLPASISYGCITKREQHKKRQHMHAPPSGLSAHTHRAVTDVRMRHLATPVSAAPRLPALQPAP